MFTKDPVQPNVEFAFGEQPIEFRNKDEGKKIGVVGAGDVWIKFQLPQIAQRGGDIYITDPRRTDIEEKILAAGVPKEKIHIVSGIAEMPKDLNQIWVLTPPHTHVPVVEEIHKHLPGVAIGLEKPITGNQEDADRLQKFVKDNDVKIYGVDWALLNAQPLFKIFGMDVPHNDALEIKGAENFKKFDINNIVSVDARDIEGGGNSLADPAKVAAGRPWMMDFRQAGGVTWDMTVHIVNVLEEMGFKTTGVDEVYLGSVTKEQGVYSRIGREDGDAKTGDMYSRAHMTLGRDGGRQDIATVMESGKNAAYNDQYIEMKDKNGHKLHWEIIPVGADGVRIPGSIATLEDPKGNVIARIGMKSDAYALVADEFSKYADEVKAKKTLTTNSHLTGHLDGVRTVVEMHRVGRELVAGNELVYQQAVTEVATRPDLKAKGDFTKLQALTLEA